METITNYTLAENGTSVQTLQRDARWDSGSSLEPPQWYAVHSCPRHEKRVAEELRLRSLEGYLPLHRCRHKWKNGVFADLELPLFPGYLFVRATAPDRIRLLQLPGVAGLAVSSACPTAIPDEEIEALRKLTDTPGAEPYPFLNAGDRVRVIAGPLAGMQGILTRRKQELRVVLSLEIIMRSISVEVSEFDIEPDQALDSEAHREPRIRGRLFR